MKSQALSRRWARRYRRLETEQWRLLRRSRTRGQTEDIHELRVTLRRLRLLLRVGRPAFERHRLDEYLGWSRRVSAATSRLRDLDVVIEWLSHEQVAPELIEPLVGRRRRAWRVASRGFFPPASPVRRAMAKPRTGNQVRSALNRRFQKRWSDLEAAVRDRLADFFELAIEDRHALRRQLRNLRYLRELKLSRKKQARDPLLRRIMQTQVAMGELQNLWIVRTVAREPVLRSQSSWIRARTIRQERQWAVAISKALSALKRS